MPFIDTLTLKADADTVIQAQDWLERTVAPFDWPRRSVFALKLSMDEALTNTLMHGFTAARSSAPRITLALSATSDHATLEITDNGSPFDPTRRASPQLAPSLDGALPGGHGLRLMRHYLDELHYSFVDGCNRLRLSVSLKPDSGFRESS